MCAKNHITYLKVSRNNDPFSTTWLLSGRRSWLLSNEWQIWDKTVPLLQAVYCFFCYATATLQRAERWLSLVLLCLHSKFLFLVPPNHT